MWTYESPVGIMTIFQDPASQLFLIEIDGNHYGPYRSAVAAADVVYTFTTGCSEWDSLDGDVDAMCNAPSDLSEWDRP